MNKNIYIKFLFISCLLFLVSCSNNNYIDNISIDIDTFKEKTVDNSRPQVLNYLPTDCFIFCNNKLYRYAYGTGYSGLNDLAYYPPRAVVKESFEIVSKLEIIKYEDIDKEKRKNDYFNGFSIHKYKDVYYIDKDYFNFESEIDIDEFDKLLKNNKYDIIDINEIEYIRVDTLSEKRRKQEEEKLKE